MCIMINSFFFVSHPDIREFDLYSEYDTSNYIDHSFGMNFIWYQGWSFLND